LRGGHSAVPRRLTLKPGEAPYRDRRHFSFSIDITLDASALRHADPVALLLGSVAAVPALHRQRAVLGTTVSELYCNALEHGVLKLDSKWKRDAEGFERYVDAREDKLARLQYGWVRIGLICSYRAQGGIATIRVDDSGAGFDCTRLEITAPDCARLEVAGADCARLELAGSDRTRFKVAESDRTRDELAAPSALHGRGLALIRALGVRLCPGEGRRGVCAIYRWTRSDQAPRQRKI
jgi:hypothetical protein